MNHGVSLSDIGQIVVGLATDKAVREWAHGMAERYVTNRKAREPAEMVLRAAVRQLQKGLSEPAKTATNGKPYHETLVPIEPTVELADGSFSRPVTECCVKHGCDCWGSITDGERQIIRDSRYTQTTDLDAAIGELKSAGVLDVIRMKGRQPMVRIRYRPSRPRRIVSGELFA